jgi:hypothetical protein
MLYAYVPFVALILMYLVCIWHVKNEIEFK